MSWQTGPATPAPSWQPPVTGPSAPPIPDDQLYATWYAAYQQLEKIKAEELRLRNEILARKFAGKPDGTHYVELPNGYKIKAIVKTNYSLDKDDAKIDAALEALAKVGNEGAFIAERLVSWKAELSLKEYKLLGDTYKNIIDKVVTTKPGQGSVELIEPK